MRVLKALATREYAVQAMGPCPPRRKGAINWLEATILCSRLVAAMYCYYGGACSRSQNQIWCVNVGEYLTFGSVVGLDYYLHHMPTRNSWDG